LIFLLILKANAVCPMLLSHAYLNKILCTGICMLVLVSCSKKDQNLAAETEIQNFSLVPGEDQADIQLSKHWISVRVPDTVQSGLNLIASYTVSTGASLAVSGISQQSGVTENDFENNLVYTLTAADHKTKQDWTIQATNNDNSIPWGLGHFINHSLSEDRTYDWYIDQSTSGLYALTNCGPASVTMAIRWADSTFSKTALDARGTYEPGGGWWTTDDINAYLNLYNIPHAVVDLSDTAAMTKSILTTLLGHNQIVILCLDMNYVRSTVKNDFRVDKFYPTTPGWGHFIVLKGYQQVDEELFFEAYDPYSFGAVNSDLTFKGMNRFYRYEDLAAACLPWWNFAFIIAKKGQPLSPDAMSLKLDPDRVPVGHSTHGIF
jgi:hypothetical protein